MEIFRTENFFVLLCGESSLWVNKKTGDLEIKPGKRIKQYKYLKIIEKFIANFYELLFILSCIFFFFFF